MLPFLSNSQSHLPPLLFVPFPLRRSPTSYPIYPTVYPPTLPVASVLYTSSTPPAPFPYYSMQTPLYPPPSIAFPPSTLPSPIHYLPSLHSTQPFSATRCSTLPCSLHCLFSLHLPSPPPLPPVPQLHLPPAHRHSALAFIAFPSSPILTFLPSIRTVSFPLQISPPSTIPSPAFFRRCLSSLCSSLSAPLPFLCRCLYSFPPSLPPAVPLLFLF
jgi:hypothetical protein